MSQTPRAASIANNHHDPETEINGREVSRNPADYSPTRHFLIRYRRECGPARETRTAPPITGDVIRKCITQGALDRDPSGPDRVRFVANVDDHEWRLIARITDQGTNEVLSAFVPFRHQPTEFNLGGGRR